MSGRPRGEPLNYGGAIRSMREAREMSLESLAEAAGVSASYLSEVERGIKRPSTDVVAKVAEAFGMRPSEFLEQVESQRVAASGAVQFASSQMRRAKMVHEGIQMAMLADPGMNKEELIKVLTSTAGRLDVEEVQILIDLAKRLAAKSK